MKNQTITNVLSLNGFSILPHWYTDRTIYIPSNPQINLLEKTMIENGIFHITISHHQEDIVYEDNNVDFLEKLKDLVIGIDIFLEHEIDLKAINHLHKLESIEIPLKRTTKIDFSNFKHLKNCRIGWQKGDETLVECRSLDRLIIWDFPYEDISIFHRFNNLQKLYLSGKIRSLLGISKLVHLKRLELSDNRRLENLDGIEDLKELKSLCIENSSRIKNIDGFKGLIQLEKLELLCRTKIQSIKSLQSLAHLSMVRLIGIEVIDGDMSPLIGKGHIVFGTFPYYNYTMKQIEDINKNMR